MRLRIVLAGIVLGVSSWLAAPVVFGEAQSGGGVCCSSSKGDCPGGYECRVPDSGDSCSDELPGECIPGGF
jgi:hypothetical protein